MARTLSEIKSEISGRFTSSEFLPGFIVRSSDLKILADSIGEFLSPYIKQLEDFLGLWSDESLLKNFLIRRGMFLSGSETLTDLQAIAQNRLKILSYRGTPKMVTELQRLTNSTSTSIEYKGLGSAGWVMGKSSPCYRESDTDLNLAYLGTRNMVVFNIHNNTKNYSNSDLKNIIQKYFEPKHIRCLYNFITG